MLLHNHGAIRIIKECSSGSEAIHTVPSLEADVVLMDINMSPVNGFEARGARGYVTKNCSKEEMVNAIHDVIKGKTFICKDVLEKMRQSGTDND